MTSNSDKKCAILLYDALIQADEKKKKEIADIFINFLKAKNSFKRGKMIVRELEKYNKKKKGIESLEITSAGELSEENLKNISNIFGKHSEITKKIEKNIIGGVIIKTEDKIFDASLKKQLKNLENILK